MPNKKWRDKQLGLGHGYLSGFVIVEDQRIRCESCQRNDDANDQQTFNGKYKAINEIESIENAVSVEECEEFDELDLVEDNECGYE